MKFWERIKKIKNKFWIILYILFLMLLVYDMYDMYYYFDMWDSEPFHGVNYKNKEAYVRYGVLDTSIYLIIFLISCFLQNKFPRVSKFLLMTPLWSLLVGLIVSIMQEMGYLGY